MNMGHLLNRPVMGSDAFIIGHVNDVEFDEKSMRLTHICLKLEDKAIEPMGLKKPRLGGLKVSIPVGLVRAIGDVVDLDRSSRDLGAFARRR